MVVGECKQTGKPAQPSVGGRDGRRYRRHVGPRRERGIEPADDLGRDRDGERWGTAHNADDAAHGMTGY